MTFASLGLSKPLLDALTEKGYTTPYPIQSKTIPAVLNGNDIMAAAQTGTGKTACFALPLLQQLSKGTTVKGNHIRALILVPTHELADQIAENIVLYGRHLSISVNAVYGGVKINPQMMKLRRGVDILVATPGRLLDLYSKNALKFNQVQTLVLDEADRMFDLGFIDDVRKIIAVLPSKRQTLLFSATFSTSIGNLAKNILKKPIHIGVGVKNSTAITVKQWIYEVDKSRKTALLIHLIQSRKWNHVLVFTRTKKGADRLAQKLMAAGILSDAIHGDKSQAQRTRTLADFTVKKNRILVATDVAARGLDIKGLPQVVNFDLPKVPEDYIHRIGRTGRADSVGEGISLVSADEVKLLSAVETILKRLLTREVESGFIPNHSVPITTLLPQRKKKPKKKKIKAGGQGQGVQVSNAKPTKKSSNFHKGSTSKYTKREIRRKR